MTKIIFMLGDTEFARNEKQAAAIGLMKNGKKVRISNLDYEEYLEEAERRECEEEEEVSEARALPVDECKGTDSTENAENAENFQFYTDIAVKADDNPVLLAQRIIAALKRIRGVTLFQRRD